MSHSVVVANITICKDTIMGMLEECTVEPTNIEQESCNAMNTDEPVCDPIELFDHSHLEPKEDEEVK